MKILETAKNVLDRSDTHAIKMLMADHREVETLFKAFEAADTGARKVAIISKICRALTLHTQLEEQIFYPESRRALQGEREDMVDEAVVEHATLKSLMKSLNGMRASDPLFKAHATVLKEYVQHHVKEEESDYFPQVAGSDLDLEAMGARMQALKNRLLQQPSKPVGNTVSFATPSARLRSKRTGAAARATGKTRRRAAEPASSRPSRAKAR